MGSGASSQHRCQLTPTVPCSLPSTLPYIHDTEVESLSPTVAYSPPYSPSSPLTPTSPTDPAPSWIPEPFPEFTSPDVYITLDSPSFHGIDISPLTDPDWALQAEPSFDYSAFLDPLDLVPIEFPPPVAPVTTDTPSFVDSPVLPLRAPKWVLPSFEPRPRERSRSPLSWSF